MREISPALELSVEEWLKEAGPDARMLVAKIREQKKSGARPKPSEKFLDKSKLLTPAFRAALLDRVAELVDENYAGRSEMCEQFATLVQKALVHLGLPAVTRTGSCVYYDDKGRTVYSWRANGHTWVAVGDEIVDGNVDSLSENYAMPKGLSVPAYWGPRVEVPRDRKFHHNPGARQIPADPDVEKIWWPELKVWLDERKDAACSSVTN